ncbi:MAG: hypothetical protein EZS28_038127 [Streblomastix strix]|uniref:Fido domain-containing protein n=1 Tax=Streblomastix strix TaxID=222440 RepID=A0A5J4U6X3_9EUKA|nr:MAG: hypothetical protein EZS28_038127 [Streblomastix strix]
MNTYTPSESRLSAYLKQCILNSNFIEQDFIPNETVNEAVQYILDSNQPNIDELYRLLFPKRQHVFRQCNVYVSGKNNSKVISADNIGIRHELIDPHYLQELVNKANQTNDPITKFKYYLIYQRIHPHEDGNGRIGRLLFLEIYNIPLSTTLRYSIKARKLMNEIFIYTNGSSVDDAKLRFDVIMKKHQIKTDDDAICRYEIEIEDRAKFMRLINDNQRTCDQYYILDLKDEITAKINDLISLTQTYSHTC